jgi:hypothetical protein
MIYFSFFILVLVILFSFLTAINLMMLIFVRKFCYKFSLTGALVFKFGGRPAFFTPRCFLPSGNVFLYYTLRTMCNSSLWVWKDTIYLFVLICLFVFNMFVKKKKKKCYVVVKYELSCNYDLHFIGTLKVLNT